MSEEMRLGNQRPLLCQKCGEVIGTLWGGEGQPDPAVVDARCYACVVVPAAERILQEPAS